MVKTAGDTIGWLVLSSVGLISIVQAISCGTDEGTTTSTLSLTTGQEDLLSALLTAFWPHVLEPALFQAEDDVDALTVSIAEWDNALEMGMDGETERGAVKETWIGAMESWQAIEMLLVGPAASSLTASGGEDIRDNVYSWPTINPCRVDQETVEANWTDSDYFTVNLVNVFGFDAMEILLFTSDEDNSCSTLIDINDEGTWDALGINGVRQHRAQYAHALSQQMAVEIQRLQDAWRPESGNFNATLTSAGSENDFYATDLEALNALFDALFYLETEVKDRKMGWALGYADCGQEDCSAFIESPFAGLSTQWIAQNLSTFRSLYRGGEGAGMHDLLYSIGEEQVADAMVEALDAADAALQKVPDDLYAAQMSHPEETENAYLALKAVTDLLKGDMATVLTLDIPQEASGDID